VDIFVTLKNVFKSHIFLRVVFLYLLMIYFRLRNTFYTLFPNYQYMLYL